jgi:hypothetical protein
VRKDPFIGRIGEQRRPEAGGQRWSLTALVSKSKKGEGSGRGTELVQGKRRRPGGTLLRLLTCTGGRPTAASGTTAPVGAAAARLRKEEDDPGALGRSGPKQGRELGRLQKIPGKWKTGCRCGLGQKENWAADLILNFISRI